MISSGKLFGEPKVGERKIFDRLLKPEFLGRDALREQLRDCLVKAIDQNGSLKILVRSDARAIGWYRIPVEGEFEDKDGVTAHVLLHVVEGKADELEVFKEDVTNKLLPEIDPSRLELFCPSLFQR